MLRSIAHSTSRATPVQPLSRISPRIRSRFISSAPPSQRSRSFKNSAVRWGIAAAGVYWYTTTAVFAEEPIYTNIEMVDTTSQDDQSPTLEAVASARKQRLAAAQASPTPLDAPSPSTSPGLSMAASVAATESGSPPPQNSQPLSGPSQSASANTVATPSTTAAPSGSPAELEEEAEGEGAFNPETGEINWDCPCLGGMAHGPCGPEFREAFSCFVYSEQEPKGVDCIDRFKNMQDCFRAHPDVYGAELTDEVDEDDYEATKNATSDPPAQRQAQGNNETEKAAKASTETKVAQPAATSEETESRRARAKAATEQVSQDHGPTSEAQNLMPKEWHDATGDNEKKE